jgi:hypothetical protein
MKLSHFRKMFRLQELADKHAFRQPYTPRITDVYHEYRHDKLTEKFIKKMHKSYSGPALKPC